MQKPRTTKLDRQTDMFGSSIPIFPNIPKWLKKPAELVYRLYEIYGTRIAEDDQYMIYQVWMSEGLADALGSEEAVNGFYEWFVNGKPSDPETITRARRWLTGKNPYMEVSNRVRLMRLKRQEMVRGQLGGDDDFLSQGNRRIPAERNILDNHQERKQKSK